MVLPKLKETDGIVPMSGNRQPPGTSTGFIRLSTALNATFVSVPLNPACWPVIESAKQILVKVSVPSVA